MDTNHDRRPILLVTAQPAPAPAAAAQPSRGGWPAVRSRLQARLRRVWSWINEYWLAGLFLAAGLTVLVLLLKLVWAILRAVGAGIGNAGDGLHRLAGWITNGPITGSINDPVRAWLDAHTAGLPATGRDLWITWLVAAAVLYLTAVAGSRYARIGWAVLGVLTAAAAYAGAGPAGPGAAGVTAAVWLLLSLLAYSRAMAGGTLLEQIVRDLTARRATRQQIAELQAENLRLRAEADAREEQAWDGRGPIWEA